MQSRNPLHLLRAVLVAVAGLSGLPAAAQSPLLWGDLKPGPFAVGYRMQYQLDYTRRYDPEYQTDSSRAPASQPRPILIAQWYPAGVTQAEKMPYGQYLEVGSTEPLVASFAHRLSYHVRQIVCEETIGKVPAMLSPVEKAAFDRLLATKTFAVKSAKSAPGRFPVLIYHPGLSGTHEDNSVLFELLASHGYVVLSSSYPHADASNVVIGSEFHTSFRDMEFLARFGRSLPYANANRLAVMGHSYGAIASLGWAAEEACPINAFITLDSGLEYVSVEDSKSEMIQDQLRSGSNYIRAANLRFASTERKPRFDYLESVLKFTPRYEASVASLEHNDYLTHGAIRARLLPTLWPDEKGVRWAGYRQICLTVLNFLNSTLKPESNSKPLAEKSVSGFSLKFRASEPIRPTLRQYAQYIRKHGPDKAMRLMATFSDEVAHGYAVGAGMNFLDEGDLKIALQHLTYTREKYPWCARSLAMLAEIRSVEGDTAGALDAYKKASEMLAKDESVGAHRSYWEYKIKKGLADLSKKG